MDRTNILLAREALPLVSEIATELAAAVASRPLGAFGARLACFVAELPGSERGLKDKQSLGEVLRKVLEEVEKACIWPQRKEPPDLSTLQSLARNRKSSWKILPWITWFSSSSTTLHNNVRKCLREYASSTEEFAKMLDVITQTTATGTGDSPLELPRFSSVLSGDGEEAAGYLSQVNSELHGFLSCHISHCSHQTLMRLRLDPRDSIDERGATCFEILFSSREEFVRPSMATEWTETRMLVPRKNPRRAQPTFDGFAATPSIVSGPSPRERLMTIDTGRFCAELKSSGNTQLWFYIEHQQLSKVERKEIVERKVHSAESIPLSQAFKTRIMSRKTRCILAYTLAKSVWQFYGSDWMRYPWTREDIHLLYDEPVGRDFNAASYFFRPYLAIDFQKDQRGIPEYVEGGMLWHRYPQVLALGILLIEVARGKPLEVPNVPLDYSRDSINPYLKSAMITLETGSLFEKKEDDFLSYRRAVEGCLKFGQFFDFPYTAGQQQPKEKDKSLEERRAIIYRNVVQPLKELLRGTRWFAEIDKMKQDIDHGSTTAQIDTPAISETRFIQSTRSGKSKEGLENLNRRSHLLYGKAQITPASWLAELVTISEKFSAPCDFQPIRIAVIDTGCDLAAPIFDIPGHEARLRGHWRDWLDESPQPRDEHGHGTKIVSLLLRILPNAEIFVERVARNQQDLDTAGGLIVKAIHHAAMVWTADIITMSFDFPDEDLSIKRAIRNAEEERNGSIIFFAAAANEGSNTKELFPANIYPVIPIRGTDCAGAFLPMYDPDITRFDDDTQLYGTLGEDVPWGWPDEGKLSSGCSIATPIAAGIAALIIQCVTSTRAFNENDQRMIRRRRAILEVFHEMSVEKATNLRYINPRNLLDREFQPNMAMIQRALQRIS